MIFGKTFDWYSSSIFKLLVFFLPFQLAYHLWPSWSFVTGIRIDYFAPSLYLQDILVLLLVLTFIANNFTKKVSKTFGKFIIIFLVLFLINLLASAYWQISILKWLRFFEIGTLILVVYFSNFHFKNDFLKPLGYSSIFVSFLGVLEFIKQKSIGGLFYLFGERSFNLVTPGIARINFDGKVFLRAYSTFSHPNSLAGFLVVVFTMFLLTNVSKNRLLKAIVLLTSFLGIIVSFSISSFIVLMLVLVYWLLRNRIKLNFVNCFCLLISAITVSIFQVFVLNYFNLKTISTSIFQRLFLAKVSGLIFIRSPLLGIGLNNFIAFLPKYSYLGNVVWLLQPVHNIFLLTLAENGLVGIITLIIILSISIVRALKFDNSSLVIALIVIFLTGISDHYWLTLYQNMSLFGLVISFSLKKKSSGIL